MKNITNFAIFKNKNATGNQPQYSMVGKPNGEEGKGKTIASLWVKKTQNGVPYYSGQMKETFTKDDGTKYDGYVIVKEEEYAELKALQNTAKTTHEQPQENDLTF